LDDELQKLVEAGPFEVAIAKLEEILVRLDRLEAKIDEALARIERLERELREDERE
jgi:exonuclease VII small subunit